MNTNAIKTSSDLQIAQKLWILGGGVNTGVLIADGTALLIDCCDTVTPARLAAIGVERVEMILCTQHRRPNVAGAYPFVETGAGLVTPHLEAQWFTDVTSYWADGKNRWHLYHHRPRPDMLPRPIRIARTVQDGDRIEWRGYTILVYETPGMTDGSVSYLIENAVQKMAFTGDLIAGPGQVWDLYSLQKTDGGGVGDYHGFLGARNILAKSLTKIHALNVNLLIPSHGDPIANPSEAIQLLETRLGSLWRNYAAVSALHHYFPGLLSIEAAGPGLMTPAATSDPPTFIRRIDPTSFVITSVSGAALLIDCGQAKVIETLDRWISEGFIKNIEGCWVTHYHDDHVDFLARAATAFNCPVIADAHLAEILTSPGRFNLPCLSPDAAPVTKITGDGDSWTWREFRVTAFHFPGQTFYHGGLLVEGNGHRVFFAGDSFSPTGIDDYNCANRCFNAAGRGFRRCLQLLRDLKPDLILNQHQPRGFRFTDAHLDYMEHLLIDRARITADLLPWSDPNFGTDEGWCRTYPYELDAVPGGTVTLSVEFTNHGAASVIAKAEPALPAGWIWNIEQSRPRCSVPPVTDGIASGWTPRPDGTCKLSIHIPADAIPGQFIIPIRITWDDRYLGQFRHAIVDVGTRPGSQH